MQTNYTEQLREVLANARKCIPENEYCGIGAVLYSDFNGLPVLPLCPKQKINMEHSLAEQLAYASLYSNPCHDGFHLISDKLLLTHTNQYFAPPLPFDKAVYADPIHHHGARYVSAQIGSLMSCVYCTGIISEKDDLVVFINGRVVK